MQHLRPFLLTNLLALILSFTIQAASIQTEPTLNQATSSLLANKASDSPTSVTKTNLEQKTITPSKTTPIVVDDSPEVGKHVMANMDAGSMVLSLLMVVGLIIVSAFVLKRFNIAQQNTKELKVVANLSLGAKERVVVVQVGEQQLVLGVTSQHINLLDTLAEPITVASDKASPLAGNVFAFLQQANTKQKWTRQPAHINQQPESK